MMLIRMAEQHQNVYEAGGYRPWLERIVGNRWRGLRVQWETQGEVYAYIVRGSWIVMCPYCNGAILAQIMEPFWCPDCCMQGNGGYAMDVIWPKNMGHIEEILSLRAVPNTRNWLLHETALDLMRQNDAHGEEVG